MTITIRDKNLSSNQKVWILKHISDCILNSAWDIIDKNRIPLIKTWNKGKDVFATGNCEGSKRNVYSPKIQISLENDVVPSCQCNFTKFQAPWCKHTSAIFVLYCLALNPTIKTRKTKKRGTANLLGFVVPDPIDTLDPNDDYVFEEDIEDENRIVE